MLTREKLFEFGFDRIIVIESLPNKEKKTGEELSRILNYHSTEIGAKYYDVDNKDSFLSTIDYLITISLPGNIPYVHFEIHGSNDRSGLVLKNGDYIEWEELSDKLRVLNRKTLNNLFLSFATCYGAYFFKEVLPYKASPCYGFIGSWDSLFQNEILLGYESFFKALLKDNLKGALYKLKAYSNNKCIHYFSDEIFERIFSRYVKTDLTDLKIIDRKYNLIRKYINEFKTLPNRHFIEDIERELKMPTKIKIKYKSIFKHNRSDTFYFYDKLLNQQRKKYF